MLPPAARIAIVAPAGMFSPERLHGGMDTLSSWGFTPIEAPNLRARHRYTAGTTEQRAADLRWALTTPGLDAVWFARGGYGTYAAMVDLPWDQVDARPVLGFSDATALLAALHRRGLNGIHAPVVQGLGDPQYFAEPGAVLIDAESRTALLDLLQGRAQPHLDGHRLCGPERVVRGPVLGGNLAVLASLCGTPEAPETRGSILLLEEVGEAPYRVDRLLTQLKAAGMLRDLAGIALGDFLGCESKDATWSLTEVLRDLLEPLGIPVIAGLPVGHGARNFAFQYGALGELTGEGLAWPKG
jgi:muramoyltetrapeptide carboxypeptidase